MSGRFTTALRGLYPRPAWAVFSEVQSATGDREGTSRADYIALAIQPSGNGKMILFEEKRSRGDFLRELGQPGKAEEIGRYCSRRFFIVPAPWKNIILTEREIPKGWGLLEVGAGGIVEVGDPPPEREQAPMTEAFMWSLIRAGDVQGSAGSSEGSVITRPELSRTHCGLGCGHVAPKPLVKPKDMPRKIPCLSCESGHGTDQEIVEAVIDDADDDVLEALAARIAHRLGR